MEREGLVMSLCCDACGVRLAVQSRDTRFPVKCVQFCHVCGESLFPTTVEDGNAPAGSRASCTGAVPKTKGDVMMGVASLSFEKVWASLLKRFCARKSQSLIRCEPCSFSCRKLESSSSVCVVDSLVKSYADENSCGENMKWRGPPLFYSWPVQSFRGDEGGEMKDNSSLIFAQLDEVKRTLSETVLELNTQFASLQARCVNERIMWRKQVGELRAELLQKKEDEVALRERVALLEKTLRERDERRADEIQKEQLKAAQELQWRRRLDEEEQMSLNAAYHVLRETLAYE